MDTRIICAVEDPDDCTSTKQKIDSWTRPVYRGDVRRRCRTRLESSRLYENKEKILKLAEVCGGELQKPDRARKYISGAFASCGMG